MKKTFLLFLTLGFLAFPSSLAQASDLNYSSYEVDYRPLQQNDPYYQLHLIHYQLYRQQYCPSCRVQVLVIGGAPREVRLSDKRDNHGLNSRRVGIPLQ